MTCNNCSEEIDEVVIIYDGENRLGFCWECFEKCKKEGSISYLPSYEKWVMEV